MANGVIGKVTAGGGTHLVTSTFYGTCTTAANTAAKIVKLADATPDSATLITGMLLAVKFTNANSAANPTLTVQRNANTTNLIAAKPIMAYGSTAAGTASGTAWRAGAVILFIYDGTNWVITDYNDYSIHQNAAITTNGAFNILGGNSANTDEQIGSVNKLSGLTYNPSTHNLSNNGVKDTGYYIQGNSVSYGRMLINAIGTAGTATTYTNPEDETQTVTGYTGNTQGIMLLELGNNKAVGTNGTGYSSPGSVGNANNARGYLRIYGANANYTEVVAQANGNRTLYLPNYNNTMYLVHAGSNSAVGSTTKPVYVAANGRITEASTYAGGTAVTLNNASKAGSTATIYAPTAGGTAGQYLKAAGATSAPTWASFTKPTVTWTGGTTAGPTLAVTTDGGASTAVAIPSATGSASGIVTTGAQTFAGSKTFSDTVVLSKTTDLSGTANNSPALIVGGAATAAHIEMDANEIQGKTNGTSVAALYINNDGGDVYIGSTTTATSSTAAGLRTPGGFAVGKKTWIGASSGAATTSNTSSQLIISSNDTGSGGNVALELWRGSNASWQISNESGDLHFRTNYTTTKQTTYSVDAVKIAYNTGAITLKSALSIANGGTGATTAAAALTNLGAAAASHTHNYAGSSSAGGAATNAVTTADTTNALYVVGVASGATTALKHDTNIIIQNNVIHPATNGTGSIGTLDTRFQTLHLTNQITIKAHTATTMPSFMMQDENAKQYVGASIPVKGTTSVEGEGRLTLGNNVATGTAGNATGRLRMYGSDAQYGDIIYNGVTQSIDFIFA